MSDIWLVKTVLTGLSGLPGVSTFFWERGNGETPPGDRSPSDVKNDVGDFWAALCTGAGSSSGGLQAGLVATTLGVMTRIDSESGEAIAFDDGGPDVVNNGNGTGEPLPPATQTLIQWHTGHFRRGRELHGRTFIPGMTEDHSTNGVPATGWHNICQDAADAIKGSGLIIWGRPIPAVDGHAAVNGDFASTSTAAVWSRFAVLRSRRD